MSEELKPCPFCAGKARIKTVDCDDVSFWKVSCDNPMCLLFNFKLYKTKEDAANDWNRRRLYEQLEAENKRLRDALNEIVNRNDFTKFCDISQLEKAIEDFNIQIDPIPLIRIAQKALKEVN